MEIALILAGAMAYIGAVWRMKGGRRAAAWVAMLTLLFVPTTIAVPFMGLPEVLDWRIAVHTFVTYAVVAWMGWMAQKGLGEKRE